MQEELTEVQWIEVWERVRSLPCAVRKRFYGAALAALVMAENGPSDQASEEVQDTNCADLDPR